MLRQGINVVSLFDGISCGQVALDRAGIIVSQYEAFEIDKYAIAVSRYNYPAITRHGNVLEADFMQFAGYDIVMGGSPCTFWSIARSNREVDKEGMGWKLFMRFVEAVRLIKPSFFIYENVASMPSGIKAYISEELGCEPILINSSRVSAQQRKRFYWTNITGITQPEDKRVLLKDILETGLAAREKSYCIDASYQKGCGKSQLDIQSGKRQMVYELISSVEKPQDILLSNIHKENALSTVKRGMTGRFCAHKVVGDDVGAALRTRADKNGRFKRLEVRNDGKLNALTTSQTDSIVCSPIRIGSLGTGGQGNRIYSIHGKTIALMANGGGHGANVGLYKIDLPDGDYTVRKLTAVEAERCQTLPDNYTAFGIDETGKTVKISNTLRYRCIGNGY